MRANAPLEIVSETVAVQPEECAGTDRELVERMARGDTVAFGALYDRYGRIAYSVALRLMRDAGTAEDVVQDAFFSLWRLAARFDPSRGAVRTYILSIVHHRAVDILRSARVQHQADGEPELMDCTPDTQNVEYEVLHQIEARKLRAAVGNLPEEQRAVVELAYFEGFPYPEIADKLHIPLGTVKSRLRLALGRLRAAPEMAGLALNVS